MTGLGGCDDITGSALLPLLHHLLYPLKRPVNLIARDGQRRGNADYVVVRFFAEHAFFFQRFAVGTRGAMQFDADPQAAAADFFQGRATQRLQLSSEVGAQFSGALGQLLVDQHTQCGAGDGAGQRIAAERASVVAGVEHAQHFFRRQHRRHRIETS